MKTRNSYICLLICAASALLTTGCNNGGAQEPFDVVIMNGRVMDPETNFDAVRNVGIRDGQIVTITEDAIDGVETIDATGHVISPGFIDTEQHGLRPWGIKVNLRDGVTTQMDFEVGAANIDEWYAAREGKKNAGQFRHRGWS